MVAINLAEPWRNPSGRAKPVRLIKLCNGFVPLVIVEYYGNREQAELARERFLKDKKPGLGCGNHQAILQVRK